MSRIYVLAPERAKVINDVLVTRMSKLESTMALVRHTIASRIFPPSLLAAHLEFCTRLAAAVPIYELDFPRRRELIPRVLESIQQAA